MAGLNGVPIIILKEGTHREKGKEAIEGNIMAARAVANAVRSTLGPKGMDKLMVDSLGDITVTNDGVTILKEMDVQHPAAKMVVEAAKAQDSEVGDGTTTAAVLAGELLRKAEELMDRGLHPTVIASGYQKAAEKAIQILKSMANPVSKKDVELLDKVAKTAMTGKMPESPDSKITNLAVELVISGLDEEDGKSVFEMDNIIVEKRTGEGIEDSEVIHGVLVDKERVHQNMPKKVQNAKIALLAVPIEMKDTETKAEIAITTSNQFQQFMEREKVAIKEVVDKVLKSGANVVFCQKGIDDMAQHHLARAGVMAFRRIRKSDLNRLSRATGANVVTSLDVLTPDDTGVAELVEERTIGSGPLTFVTGCKNPSVVSVLLRAGTKQVLDGLDRALDDAIHAVATAVENKYLVPGGGAVETELYLRIKEYATSLKGRDQLAVEKFAEALEVIPKTLAENAGFSPIDKMVSLKSKHESKGVNFGLDAYTGEIVDMWSRGVVDPLSVKSQAILSATDAATLILRIDDVIASAKREGGMPQGGMPPGMMGGMPPGMMGGMPPGMM